ncbi:MAG: class II glutamine amidotransferase [Burkholderiaceae bacterium]
MCQLFALSCNVSSAVTFSFTGFSARGGRTGEHGDGFGLAFHDGADCRHFVDAGRASDSALAEFLRWHPIRARTVLAHIRKATQGAVQLANSHPFVREWQGRPWSFCHNGDLKNFHPRLTGSVMPVGGTDSERAFCWLLQELRRRFRGRRTLSWLQLAPAIAELADRIAAHGNFNFLLCDGEALYVRASTRLHWVERSHPFATAHLVDHDLTLDLGTANGVDDKMVLVATEPLTRNEQWQPFEAGEMQVFVAGRPVWRHAPSAPAQVAEVALPDHEIAPATRPARRTHAAAATAPA